MQSVSVIIVAVLFLSSNSILLKAISPNVSPVFKFATILYTGIFTFIFNLFSFFSNKGSTLSINCWGLIILLLSRGDWILPLFFKFLFFKFSKYISSLIETKRSSFISNLFLYDKIFF